MQAETRTPAPARVHYAGRVRRAKLYYLRKLRGKAARIVERRDNSAKATQA